jgi:hypothetical protein
MLLKRITSWLIGSLAILIFGQIAQGQDYQPFIDPGYFHSDLQFFAPATDIDDYGGPVMREGWFGSYDRMYLRVSRPDDVDSYNLMDRGWGNRWDLGYMIDDVNHDHGWLFSYSHITGPNVYEVTRQEKINRVNEDDEGRPDADDDDPDLVVPVQDRNDSGPPDQARFYDVRDSLNVINMNSIEVNKLFRMEPLNQGGLLEPFFGFRYVQFQSTYLDETYIRYDELGFVFPFPPALPNRDLFDIADAETEDLISDKFRYTNDMIGGQLGLRWTKRVSRWNLSSEFRAIGFHNFQNLTRWYKITRTYYDGGGTGSEVDGNVESKFVTNWHATATVVATDIRAEAAYEVTRDVSLHVGMQYLGFFTGIGRGYDIRLNSQDLNMVGITFGFVVNR